MKGKLLCLLLVLLPLLPTEAAASDEIYVARVDGEISGSTTAYVGRVISEAEENEARAVLIRMDTPGGGLDPTREMVQRITNAEKVPVIVYVEPRGAQAASAGAIILMSSDVAAMAPQTSTGATTPVSFFGQEIPGPMGDKVTNDTVSLITSLAAAHGRNEEWAEKAVREAASVNAGEALEMGIVGYVESDLRSVLEAADGKTVEPKGIELQIANASLVQKEQTFQERFGIPLYLVLIPAVVAVLLGVGVIFAVIQTMGQRVATGREGMVGEVGEVRNTVDGSTRGLVFVHGERWQAFPEDPGLPPIEPGTEVEIASFRRGAIIVRPYKER
jgi:membrane-bound serine protease (ClpP class)